MAYRDICSLSAENEPNGLLGPEVKMFELKARLAETLLALGKFPEAAAHFRESLRQQPEQPKVKAELAELLATQPGLK